MQYFITKIWETVYISYVPAFIYPRLCSIFEMQMDTNVDFVDFNIDRFYFKVFYGIGDLII